LGVATPARTRFIPTCACVAKLPRNTALRSSSRWKRAGSLNTTRANSASIARHQGSKVSWASSGLTASGFAFSPSSSTIGLRAFCGPACTSRHDCAIRSAASFDSLPGCSSDRFGAALFSQIAVAHA
jgi:hypothetical protein